MIIPQTTAKKQKGKEQSYILLTFRSGIQKLLPTTYYKSDGGWGCMLRVGQMFIANLYYKLQKKTAQQIIHLFYDNKLEPFSFQMITNTVSTTLSYKKQYQWFTPSQCGFIIKQILDKYDQQFRTNICNDNCIFLNEIQQDRQTLIIMVMCRIGLDEPQPEYLKCILTLMDNHYFNSVLGGTPQKAHLFFQHMDGYLGFLDPHYIQDVPPYDQLQEKQSEFISKLQWIKQQSIDCSMAVVFVVPLKQLEQFWSSLEKTKQQLGQSFFIYMERQKPVFDIDDMGIIEIIDNQQLMTEQNR